MDQRILERIAWKDGPLQSLTRDEMELERAPFTRDPQPNPLRDGHLCRSRSSWAVEQDATLCITASLLLRPETLTRAAWKKPAAIEAITAKLRDDRSRPLAWCARDRILLGAANDQASDRAQSERRR